MEAEGNALEAYAGFGNGKAIIVVPNQSAAATIYRAHVPFGTMGVAGANKYMITDLLNGKVVADQAAAPLTVFEATVSPDSVGGSGGTAFRHGHPPGRTKYPESQRLHH